MKKILAVLIIPFLIAGFAILNSCKNRSEEKQKKEQEQEQVESIEKELQKNIYEIPSSANIIKMLTDLEVGYIIGITNPVENVKKYFTSGARAINLGVYGADLSYATLYNQEQKVIDYMDAIRSVANELNMSAIYDATLYDSIKVNYDNKEKLVDILTSAFNKSYEYLSENDQQPLALLTAGGAWVEGMYLTTNVSEAAYNVATIAKILLEQKNSFMLYLDLTKPYMDNSSVSEFVNNLAPIKTVYDGLGTSLTEKNLADIKEAMAIIRNKIIL